MLVGLRLAFSTVNDALGAAPDAQFVDAIPEPVRSVIDYGRRPRRGARTDPRRAPSLHQSGRERLHQREPGRISGA